MKFTRRRALAGLGVIGAASAGAGAGTMAYFSDTESSTGNTISAGTLDLTIDGNNGQATTTVNVGDVAPGDSSSGSSTLTNTGSIDGTLDLVFGSAANSEGATPDAETDQESPGDLGAVLETTVSINGSVIRSGTFNEVFDGSETNTYIPLFSGTTKDLTIDWTLPTSAGNDVQGDIVTGNIDAELNQIDADAGGGAILSLDGQEQYQQLQSITFTDPYELEIKAVKPNGEPFTGEITASEKSGEEFITIINHEGSYGDTPETSGSSYAPGVDLDFDSEGILTLTLGNSGSPDVTYSGFDVQDFTTEIDVNLGAIDAQGKPELSAVGLRLPNL